MQYKWKKTFWIYKVPLYRTIFHSKSSPQNYFWLWTFFYLPFSAFSHTFTNCWSSISSNCESALQSCLITSFPPPVLATFCPENLSFHTYDAFKRMFLGSSLLKCLYKTNNWPFTSSNSSSNFYFLPSAHLISSLVSTKSWHKSKYNFSSRLTLLSKIYE